MVDDAPAIHCSDIDLSTGGEVRIVDCRYILNLVGQFALDFRVFLLSRLSNINGECSITCVAS